MTEAAQLAARPVDLDGQRLGVVTGPSRDAHDGADRLVEVLARRHFLGSTTRISLDDPGENVAALEEIASTCDVVVVVLIEDEGTLPLVDFGAAVEGLGVPCAVIVREGQQPAAATRAAALGTPKAALVAIPASGVDELGVAGPVLSLVEGSLTSPGEPPTVPPSSPIECTC